MRKQLTFEDLQVFAVILYVFFFALGALGIVRLHADAMPAHFVGLVRYYKSLEPCSLFTNQMRGYGLSICPFLGGLFVVVVNGVAHGSAFDFHGYGLQGGLLAMTHGFVELYALTLTVAYSLSPALLRNGSILEPMRGHLPKYLFAYFCLAFAALVETEVTEHFAPFPAAGCLLGFIFLISVLILYVRFLKLPPEEYRT